MVTVDISEIQENYGGPMLIVRDSLGVCYRTQAGGVRCTKPHQQGFLVPLVTIGGENHLLKEFTDDWYEGVRTAGAAYASRRDALDLLLKAWHLDTVLEPLCVYTAEKFDLCAWGEAWIPVRIKEDIDPLDMNGTALSHSLLQGSYAILTYQNSD